MSAAVQATVIAELPNRLYRLQTEDGTYIIAGLSPAAMRLGAHFKPGDRVHVQRAKLDPGRGTILEPAKG